MAILFCLTEVLYDVSGAREVFDFAWTQFVEQITLGIALVLKIIKIDDTVLYLSMMNL